MLWWLLASLLAQGNIVLSGHVRDRHGHGIAGVVVVAIEHGDVDHDRDIDLYDVAEIQLDHCDYDWSYVSRRMLGPGGGHAAR